MNNKTAATARITAATVKCTGGGSDARDGRREAHKQRRRAGNIECASKQNKKKADEKNSITQVCQSESCNTKSQSRFKSCDTSRNAINKHRVQQRKEAAQRQTTAEATTQRQQKKRKKSRQRQNDKHAASETEGRGQEKTDMCRRKENTPLRPPLIRNQIKTIPTLKTIKI